MVMVVGKNEVSVVMLWMMMSDEMNNNYNDKTLWRYFIVNILKEQDDNDDGE